MTGVWTPTNAGIYEVIGTIQELNYAGSATNTLTIAAAAAEVLLSDLSQVYDGTGRSAAAQTEPEGLTVELTYDGSLEAPTNAGIYEVIGTIQELNYVGSATNMLTIAAAAAEVLLSDLSQVYDGTGRSAAAQTEPEGLTVELTYDGSLEAPTNAGIYEVIGTIQELNYAGSATNTLTIAAAAAEVLLSDLSQVYDGTGRSATAQTEPEGLTVELTYDGSLEAPTNAGIYEVIGTIQELNYAGSATNTLTIAAAAAEVLLSDLSQVYDGTARSVTAQTEPEGLTVELTYDGSLEAPTNAGIYEVIGTIQELNYAGSATNTLTIAAAAAEVLLSDLSQVYDGTGRSAAAQTEPEGLTVELTYDGSLEAPTNAGIYEVIGTIQELNYAGSATNTLTIAKAPLVVTANNATKFVGTADPEFAVSFEGFAFGEDESVLDGALAFTREPGETTGEYAIQPEGLSASNYAIAFASGVLTIVPASEPIIQSLALSGSNKFVITWSAVPDITYLVQYRSDPGEGDWIDLLPPVTATSSLAVATDEADLTQERFYRVIVP
jgi:hypothetical protein